MLFHVYGDMAVYQWIAMIAVLLGLILLNEFARRTFNLFIKEISVVVFPLPGEDIRFKRNTPLPFNSDLS